jgi:hypothetical protein
MPGKEKTITLLCPQCGTPLEVERNYSVPQTITVDEEKKFRTTDDYTDISDVTGELWAECVDCGWDSDYQSLESFVETYPDCVVVDEEES